MKENLLIEIKEAPNVTKQKILYFSNTGHLLIFIKQNFTEKLMPFQNLYHIVLLNI